MMRSSTMNIIQGTIACIAAILISFAAFDLMSYKVAEAGVCEQYGMSKGIMMESDVCIDNNNDAHFVNIECESVGLFEYSCKARFVSVGEVRVR